MPGFFLFFYFQFHIADSFFGTFIIPKANQQITIRQYSGTGADSYQTVFGSGIDVTFRNLPEHSQPPYFVKNRNLAAPVSWS